VFIRQKCGGFSFGAEGGIRVKPVSVSQFQKSPCQLVSIIPKVKKCKKMVQKVCILVHFCSKHVHFCKKNAKKRKKTLIFTLIFSPKTHKSYKIILFTTASHPKFQNFPQKPLFPPIFRLFFSFFTPFFFRLLSSVLCLPASSDRSHRLGARIPVTGPRFCAFYEWKEAGCSFSKNKGKIVSVATMR